MNVPLNERRKDALKFRRRLQWVDCGSIGIALEGRVLYSKLTTTPARFERQRLALLHALHFSLLCP